MKSQGIIFSVRKASWKMIDLSDVCRNSSFDQWFSVFFIIHLANLRSVKIVQKSVKSQRKVREFFSFWWVATLNNNFEEKWQTLTSGIFLQSVIVQKHIVVTVHYVYLIRSFLLKIHRFWTFVQYTLSRNGRKWYVPS